MLPVGQRRKRRLSNPLVPAPVLPARNLLFGVLAGVVLLSLLVAYGTLSSARLRLSPSRRVDLLVGSHSTSVYSFAFQPPSTAGAFDGRFKFVGTDEVGASADGLGLRHESTLQDPEGNADMRSEDVVDDEGDEMEHGPPPPSRPSYLCAHPKLRGRLYGVLEREQGEGGLVALDWEEETGIVTVVDERLSGGQAPIHCLVTSDGSQLIATNYGGGSIVFISLLPSGHFSPDESVVHTLPNPSAPHPPRRNLTRQSHSHPQQGLLVKDELWVVDGGGDCVWRLKAQRAGDWTRVTTEQILVGQQIGEGWRRAIVSKNGRDVYVIGQHSLTLLHYRLPRWFGPPRLVSRTRLRPRWVEQLPLKGASATELRLLPPSTSAPYGGLMAATMDVSEYDGDDLVWLPLRGSGEVDLDKQQRIRPIRGKSLRGMSASADGLYVFAVGQSDGWLDVFGQDQQGIWRELAQHVGGPFLQQPTTILVL